MIHHAYHIKEYWILQEFMKSHIRRSSHELLTKHTHDFLTDNTIQTRIYVKCSQFLAKFYFETNKLTHSNQLWNEIISKKLTYLLILIMLLNSSISMNIEMLDLHRQQLPST